MFKTGLGSKLQEALGSGNPAEQPSGWLSNVLWSKLHHLQWHEKYLYQLLF